MNATLSFISHSNHSTVTARLAANAGSTVIQSIAVPVGMMAIARVRIVATTPAPAPLSVVADATADTLTAVAHGYLSGQPVQVSGTTLPTGVTAGTTYYANAATVDTIKLYDTQAHAVAGGATGLVDITAVGAGVILVGTTVAGVYFVDVAAKNENGVTSLVGAANKVALEDISAWDVTAAANNTKSTIEISATPDTVQATAFKVDTLVELVNAEV